MSNYLIDPNEEKKVSSQITAERDRIAEISERVGSVDLSGIGSQGSSVKKNLEELARRIKIIETETADYGDKLERISVLYENTDHSLRVGVYNLEESEIENLSDVISNLFPNKSSKKIAKNILKKILKDAHKGLEKYVDVAEMVKKFEDGDYWGIVEKLPGLGDIKGWDFSSLKSFPTMKDIGDAMDTKGLKITAIIKTLKMVTDSDGYIANYKEKYETQATNQLMNGDILGALHSISSEFVQTVGKGTVDVTCQLISDGLDGLLKVATFGYADLSTLNAVLDDTIGFSPGSLFNATSDAISDGVDYILDDMIPNAADAVGNMIGSAVDAGGKAISSGVKMICDFFK